MMSSDSAQQTPQAPQASENPLAPDKDMEKQCTDTIEILLRLYENSVADRQHLESQCINTSNYLALIALGAVGFVKLGETTPLLCIFLSLFVIGIAVYGRGIVNSHCKSRQDQITVSHRYFKKIHILRPSLDSSRLEPAYSDDDSKGAFKQTKKTWGSIYWVILGLGIFLLLSSIGHLEQSNWELFPPRTTSTSTPISSL